jgi:hypothetical protein
MKKLFTICLFALIGHMAFGQDLEELTDAAEEAVADTTYWDSSFQCRN